MPIKCLNCLEKFDELEAYYRHNLQHSIDHGVAFDSEQKAVIGR